MTDDTFVSVCPCGCGVSVVPLADVEALDGSLADVEAVIELDPDITDNPPLQDFLRSEVAAARARLR